MNLSFWDNRLNPWAGGFLHITNFSGKTAFRFYSVVAASSLSCPLPCCPWWFLSSPLLYCPWLSIMTSSILFLMIYFMCLLQYKWNNHMFNSQTDKIDGNMGVLSDAANCYSKDFFPWLVHLLDGLSFVYWVPEILLGKKGGEEWSSLPNHIIQCPGLFMA